MNPIIQSVVQISSADIANAVFANLQQKLVAKYEELKAQNAATFAAAKELSAAYINSLQARVEEEHGKHLESLCSLLYAVNKESFGWKITPSDHRWGSESIGDAYLYRCGFMQDRLYVCLPQFVSTVYEVDNNDEDQGNFFGAGLEVIPVSEPFELPGLEATVEFLRFKKELTELYKNFSSVQKEAKRIKAVINGEIDSNTGLSLKNHVEASVATQAISQVPELVQRFDLNAIALNLNQRLIGVQ